MEVGGADRKNEGVERMKGVEENGGIIVGE